MHDMVKIAIQLNMSDMLQLKQHTKSGTSNDIKVLFSFFQKLVQVQVNNNIHIRSNTIIKIFVKLVSCLESKKKTFFMPKKVVNLTEKSELCQIVII